MMDKILLSEVDLSYPIIQACGPRYRDKIKEIYEIFECENFYNFIFGRAFATRTVYFIRKGSNIINVCSLLNLEPELRKYVILAKNF